MPFYIRLIKRIRRILIPPQTYREYILWQSVKVYREKGLGKTLVYLFTAALFLFNRWVDRMLQALRPAVFKNGNYPDEFDGPVTVYTDGPVLRKYLRREALNQPKRQQISVSLISTTFNEKDSALPWLESLASQTRVPDEVVIVDGGSLDGTLEILHSYAAHSPFPMQVISAPGANIARGRNLAIEKAQYPFIACSDFGCRLALDWLEKIIAPFEINPDIQLVAGWYRLFYNSSVRLRMLDPKLEEIHPERFLPSSRSLAFHNSVWKAVGGYPEWLTLTGEDTLFAMEAKLLGGEWAFSPDAVVEWRAPESHREYWGKLRSWASGDGESSLNGTVYWMACLKVFWVPLLTLAAGLISWLVARASNLPLFVPVITTLLVAYLTLLISFSGSIYRPKDLAVELISEYYRAKGYLQGTRRRRAVSRRRFEKIRRVFFILSGVPIDDTGGGARATQLALEFLHQGCAVVFVNRFPKYESSNLQLSIRHPNLVKYALEDFSWEEFGWNYAALLEKPLAALVEFPLGEFLPLISRLREHSATVIYDLLDAWDTSLGGEWYDAKKEQQVIASSQVLIATETSLVNRLERLSGRPVACLPNAVNLRLFDRSRHWPCPADFPPAEWSILYIGAMWGEWFDWALLENLARRYPDAAVIAIGDYHGQCPHPPPNLNFLGLKPQSSLPAYLAQASVAIIPWKISPITQATSPLKVYEYLAMHRPVVAPDLPPLRGLPGVLLAGSHDEFIAKVEAARRMKLPSREIDQFIAENHWGARVREILDLVKSAESGDAAIHEQGQEQHAA